MISLKEQFNIEKAFELAFPAEHIKVWYFLDKMGGKATLLREIHESIPDNVTICLKTVSRAVRNLVQKNLAENTRHYAKGTPRLIIGVYTISQGSNVYVGQSKNTTDRWKRHKGAISRGIHPYFKDVDPEELVFKVVSQCERDELMSKELLLAQKIKSEGKTLLNENNFTLL